MVVARGCLNSARRSGDACLAITRPIGRRVLASAAMSREVSAGPTTTNEEPVAVDKAVVETPVDKTSTGADSDIETDSSAGGWSSRLRGVSHPATLLTLAGVAAFTIVFGRLGVTHYQNFGSWSFDMGIYDQGFWLVSRGGESFVTVRGLEFWGHHVNLVALLFAPFYWLAWDRRSSMSRRLSPSAWARCPCT